MKFVFIETLVFFVSLSRCTVSPVSIVFKYTIFNQTKRGIRSKSAFKVKYLMSLRVPSRRTGMNFILILLEWFESEKASFAKWVESTIQNVSVFRNGHFYEIWLDGNKRTTLDIFNGAFILVAIYFRVMLTLPSFVFGHKNANPNVCKSSVAYFVTVSVMGAKFKFQIQFNFVNQILSMLIIITVSVRMNGERGLSVARNGIHLCTALNYFMLLVSSCKCKNNDKKSCYCINRLYPVY